MPHKILVSEPISEVGLAELRRSFTVDYRPELADSQLVAALADADALIVRSKTKVTAEAIAAGERLRVIGRAGVGYDNIDLEAATARGILVMNVPDANTISATEHTFALMFALARRIPAAVRSMSEGKWARAQLVGHELFEKTLGIVGFGRIGKEVAQRARAFGMRVLVQDPFVTPERAADLGVELAELDPLLAESDVVTLHCPLTDTTRKLIDAGRLALMKRSAFLINCARGGILDEEALVAALKEGRLAGAALDVFPKEPPDFTSPLHSSSLPGLICTPHLGASTEEAQEKVGTAIARQVAAALLGGEYANSVNLPAIEPSELRRLQPYMRLGERLGAFMARWMPSRMGGLELSCEGEVAGLEVEFVRRSVLRGFLSCCLDGPVTAVNAPQLARQSGLELTDVRRPGPGAGRLVLSMRTAGESHQLAGGLSAAGDPRLHRVDGFELELGLEGNILLFFHRDKPGVIGRVGTILGDSHINIGRMEVGRRGQGDDAIMVLTVDSEVPAPVLARLGQLGEVAGVKMISI